MGLLYHISYHFVNQGWVWYNGVMENTTPERVKILNEAADLIVGQRQQDYGTPEVNFQRIADLANIIFRENLEKNIPLSARQAADFMILLKMARTINSPTRDSYVDIGGYAGIAGELAEVEKSKQATDYTIPYDMTTYADPTSVNIFNITNTKED